MAAVSFSGTKSSHPTDKDMSDLYYVVEYLRATQDVGHIIHPSESSELTLYCEVDASYLLHPDSKGHTGYTISFNGTNGTFNNRSVKQTAVATSSTHAEARAIFTLAKDINFIIAICQELSIPLQLPPAIVMEDNSAVVTMANNDTSYAKKCKHFLMVVNYVKEQIATGQMEARKIFGKLNNADLHTKPLRSQAFTHMAAKVLGQPGEVQPPNDSRNNNQVEIVSSDMNDMEVARAPTKGLTRQRSDSASEGAKRRKAHVLRYITTTPQSASLTDT